MSTSTTKYILAIGGALAVHFATAADGSDSIQILDINEAALMTFDSKEHAKGYKDKLCRSAVALESVAPVKVEIYTDYTLEKLCELEVEPYTPKLIVA